MDTSLYDIRRDLSRALAELHEAQQNYPDDPTLRAIDNLQSALERLVDLVEEMRSAPPAATPARTSAPSPAAISGRDRARR